MDSNPELDASRGPRLRSLGLITLALVVLAASAGHLLAPKRAAVPVEVTKPVVAAKTTPSPGTKRPYGVLHMDGLDIPAPEMNEFERAFVHTLIAAGFVVQRVDASPWDTRLDHADADNVETDHGEVTVIAPNDAGRPLLACSRAITVGGGDLPIYEISAGGDSITVELGGVVDSGRVAEVLVLTQDLAMWQRLDPIATPVNCPGR